MNGNPGADKEGLPVRNRRCTTYGSREFLAIASQSICSSSQGKSANVIAQAVLVRQVQPPHSDPASGLFVRPMAAPIIPQQQGNT
jgi:hypothetical protein